MTKLIIQHLWSDFKKHWPGILVTLVLCYIATIFVFTFGFWFFMVDSEAYLLSEAELRKMILNGSDSCDIGIVLYCYHFCVYLWILVFHGGFRSLLAFRG